MFDPEADTGFAFFKGALLLPLFCPRAELTRSPNKLGFLFTIPTLDFALEFVAAEEEPQLFPNMSPTIEFGPLANPGGVAAGWWVHDGLGCEDGVVLGLGCVDANEDDDVYNGVWFF